MLVSGIGIVLFCVGLSIGPESRAATLSWSGGGATGNWSDSANWGFVGVPGNGDTLIFSSGQPRLVNTNNLSSLVLSEIRFVGAAGGYAIYGNAFTLTNSLQATNTAGANTLYNNLTLATANLTVNVSGGSLTLNGALSGTMGLTKTGPGTLTYAGASANSYSGPTTVNGGLLQLNKTPVDGSINAGSLTITGATVRELAAFQLGAVPVSVNAGGLFDLNGFSDTIGDSLTLNGGGDVQTGAGTLNLLSNNTITGSSGSTLSGNLSISSGTSTWQGSGTMTLSANVSGSANISKDGNLSIFMNGANTFSGSFTINGGWVSIGNPLSLGTTNSGTTVNGTGFLAIPGGITVTNEALTLNSTSDSGALYVYGSDNTWLGSVALGAATTVQVFTNCSLDINGAMTGTGGFRKFGPGTLTLSGATNNTYSGATILEEGLLELNKSSGWSIGAGSLTVGDGLGGADADIVRYTGASSSEINTSVPIFIASSGRLDLNGHSDDVGAITMDGGEILTGAGVLRITRDLATIRTDPTNSSPSISGILDLYYGNRTFTVSNTLYLSASVIGSAGTEGLIKTGPNTLYLTASNTYGGLTQIRKGFLWVQNASALGTTAAGTVVSNGASLVMYGSFGITNESLELNGSGAPSYGALDSEGSYTNFWVAPITMNADSTIAPYGSGSHLHVIGPISGAGGLTKGPGSGTLFLEGNIANTYAGVTRVNSGTLVLNKPISNQTVPGNVILYGTLRLGRYSQVADTADVLIQSTGLFDCTNTYDYIDTLHGSGTVNFDDGGYLRVGENNGTSTFDGSMVGSGFIGGWALGKSGTGTFTLTGTNTYTSYTRVYGGTLVVNGYQPQSAVIVDSGGTLGGVGAVGDIICSGSLAPGASPGVITSSNLTFSASGDYYVELTGPAAGADYDQVNVRGTNNLGGATLHLIAAFTTPVGPGDQFRIINNDGAEVITGTFAGLPNSSAINVGAYTFTISYGNDVVLTLTNVPGAAGGAAITMGNGNHAVDPNECNGLDLVISNQTAVPMTGVAATLSTPTPYVVITQPYSDYPDVPGSGSSTNVTPFQIATLPGFIAGSDIHLELTVNSATHGSFIIPVLLHSGAPSAVASRYDINVSTNIPDVGAIESTNVVGGFTGPLTKVGVSFWLTHPYDADLDISLISPAGVVVDLSSGNGTGANFGSSCSPDGSRTTFDGDAATPITAGTPPFVGTFRPEGSLASLVGGTANGNWRLRVTDNNGGTLGALRCWSLFLYPIESADGGGYCDVCLPAISGAITGSDPVQTNRWNRDGLVGSCGSPKAWTGFGATGTNYHYNVYTFTNSMSGDACVTVLLLSSSNVMAAAYLDSFDPSNITNNFLGDAGDSTLSFGGQSAFSCSVPAGARFLVTVNEVIQDSGTLPYTLLISGLPCPPPTLAIEPSSPAPNVRVHWPTSAGGYRLEATPSLNPSDWFEVNAEPITSGGHFNVTNTAPPTNRFYRLHKP